MSPCLYAPFAVPSRYTEDLEDAVPKKWPPVDVAAIRMRERERERREGRRRRRGGKRRECNARCARKERENVASAESLTANAERSVHSLSDQRLKATLNEMNAFTCLLRACLGASIRPFISSLSAALFWVAALSPRPPQCIPSLFPLPARPLPAEISRVI